MGNYQRPTGWAVRRKSDGAWLADKAGKVAWVTDQFDWDIVVWSQRDYAEMSVREAGEEVVWKGVGLTAEYPDGRMP